ncbi:MAG: efflux RND transporter permease subunit [Candidatus Margulisiibacteriota bacterium]
MKDNQDNSRNRFLLTEFALKNKTSFFVLAILIMIVGIFSYIQLPKTDFPDVKFPYIYISCIYPGAAPEDIETLVVNPLERELKSLNDIKEVKSTSYESYAIVFLEFNPEVNVDTALQKVKEKVDLAKPNLPQDIKEPQINEISIDKIPAMIVNLSGPIGLVNLKAVAEKLQDKIDGVPGVLETKIVGGLDKEVKILVDIWALNQYRLSLNDVVGSIGRDNVNIPGGTVDAGNLKYLVRVPGEFHDFSEIQNVILKADNNSLITLGDVATPVFGYKDDSSVSRYNLTNSVSIVITRRAGENIVQLSENVNKLIKENQRDIPKNVKINIIGDRSEFIISMLNELINTIITGIILVFLVLLAFMGKRNAMFVAIAIPLSMFITLIVIRLLGYSLNMIVLFGLILVSGRLVDDGIVVVENIFRHMQEGEEPYRAADHATAEVAWPVIASTATTLSAFVPLLFWPGMMGQFMKYLPQVFMIAMATFLCCFYASKR